DVVHAGATRPQPAHRGAYQRAPVDRDGLAAAGPALELSRLVPDPRRDGHYRYVLASTHRRARTAKPGAGDRSGPRRLRRAHYPRDVADGSVRGPHRPSSTVLAGDGGGFAGRGGGRWFPTAVAGRPRPLGAPAPPGPYPDP